jgi:Protease inhibitor Inh
MAQPGRVVAVLSAAFALAACQDSAQYLPPPQAAPAPVVVPAAVAPGAIPGSPAPVYSAASGSSTEAARAPFLGRWTITDGSNNRTCSIFLTSSKSFGYYRAYTQNCFTKDLTDISTWELVGYQVVLRDSFRNTLASLRVSGPNRLDGQIASSGQSIGIWR